MASISLERHPGARTPARHGLAPGAQAGTGSFSACGVTLLVLWPCQWPSGWSCVAPCGRLWPQTVNHPVHSNRAAHQVLSQG